MFAREVQLVESSSPEQTTTDRHLARDRAAGGLLETLAFVLIYASSAQ